MEYTMWMSDSYAKYQMVDIQTGDRLLENGTKIKDNKKVYTFLSSTIQKVMTDLGEQEGYNLDYVMSHAGTLVWQNGVLYVFEAVENGFVPREFYEHYKLDEDDMIIVRPRKAYSKEEQQSIFLYANKLVAWNNFYEYWALLLFLPYVYIRFKKKNGKYWRLNLFGIGNKFSLFCYEGCGRIAKHERPEDYPDKKNEIWTCFDLLSDKEHIIYDNHIKFIETNTAI